MRPSTISTAVAILFCALPALADDNPLSLDDLGFKPTETQSDPTLQLKLEKRTSMLKTHQVLGLITAVPMIAQFFLANGVKQSATRRDIHAGVGIGTTVLYATTASFAIFAPKPAGITDKGTTKIHRALAWVHGPLMIATPILGILAYDQLNAGERVSGVAKLHGLAAGLLTVSYLTSLAVMTFNF